MNEAPIRPRVYTMVGTATTLALVEIGLTLGTSYTLFLTRFERILFVEGSFVAWFAVTLASSLALSCLRVIRDPRRRSRTAAAVAALVVSPAAWFTLAGRKAYDYRVVLTIAACLVAALITHRVVGWLEREHETRARSRLLLAAAVTLVVVDHVVLPRLYPLFHIALAAAAALAAGATVRMAPSGPWVRRTGVVVAALGLSALGVTAVIALAQEPNARFVVEEHAPLTGKLLRLLPQRSVEAVEEELEVIADQAGPDWQGRSVLMVTVDALRADAIGADTPVLAALADSSVVFERAYTPTPHTSYALSSLLTGKFLRPVMRLPGAPSEHRTLASVVRDYGYRTAAFYPPAVFYVDGARFAALADRGFDFEYRKTMFAAAADRPAQLDAYFEEVDPSRPVLVWVHLFEPHEPYDPPPEFRRGESALDRYRGEVAASDAAIGELIARFRAARPEGVVLVSADHGEEFGEHGGYHHGTTLYEEQVAVPLLWSAPGLTPRRVRAPVELVDVVPTLLSALSIPRDARMRGDDLGGLLLGGDEGPRYAFADVGEQRMVADERWKAICEGERCRLFDLQDDPGERHNQAGAHEPELARLRGALAAFVRSIPDMEAMALSGDVGWPEALAAAELGEGRAEDLLPLLGSENVAVRAAAARLLCRTEHGPARDALVRLGTSDPNEGVRAEALLCAAQLGAEPAPVETLLDTLHPPHEWGARAALWLAGEGRPRVEWLSAIALSEASIAERKRATLALGAAAGGAEESLALDALEAAMAEVNLRVEAATALGAFRARRSRRLLMNALREERYAGARAKEAEVLVALGEGRVQPLLVRWLGTPEPLMGGTVLLRRLGQRLELEPRAWRCDDDGCVPTSGELSISPAAGARRVVLTVEGELRADGLDLGPVYSARVGDEAVELRDLSALVPSGEGAEFRVQGPGRVVGYALVPATSEPPPPPPEPFEEESPPDP